MNRSELYQKASAFRSELNQYYARNPDVNHSTNFVNPARGRFPLDHCKAAAFMFGEYLINHIGVDSGPVYYAWGERNKESHGWLIYDGWIIDLTADQFDDEKRSVIVEPVEDSEWHQSFGQPSVHPFNLRRDHKFVQVATEIAAKLEERAV
jgi:hypothetical protein